MFLRQLAGRFLAGGLMLALLAGCGAEVATPTAVVVPPTATSPAATATTVPATSTTAPEPTATTVPPTATSAPPSPTTAPATATAEPTATIEVPDVSSFEWSPAGLEGERIGAIALLNDGTRRALAAGPNGVWISGEFYRDWQPVSGTFTFAPETRLFDIAVGDGVIYLTNYVGCAAGLPTAHYRSLDNGATWEEMGGDAMDISAGDGQVAFGINCAGIVKTTDAGVSWQQIEGGRLTNYDPIRIEVAEGGRTIFAIYASEGGSGALQISRDAGETWELISPAEEGSEEFFGPAGLAYATSSGPADDPGGLFVAVMGGLWYLPAGGGEWQHSEAVELSASSSGANYILGPIALDTSIDTAGGTTAYVARSTMGDAGLTNYEVFRTSDGGATWEATGKGLPATAQVNALRVAPLGPTANPSSSLLVGTDNGIWALPLIP